MPEGQTQNGRIPVIQTELRHINEGINEIKQVLKEHCAQDEETRKRQALIKAEQEAHCKEIAKFSEAVHNRATKAEVEELRGMIKNPWVIALGSGGTVGIILQVAPAILKALTGGP